MTGMVLGLAEDAVKVLKDEVTRISNAKELEVDDDLEIV